MSFVRVAPPKAKFLNKSIIMLAVGGCALLLVFAFVSALQPPAQRAQHYRIDARNINVMPMANIGQLPNYSQAEKINLLLNRHRPPIVRAPLWATWLEGQLEQMTSTQQQMINQAQRLAVG